MALAVPPPNRSRASSTCVRPALSINTLGRRRSSSLVLPIQHTDPIPVLSDPSSSASVTTSQPSMLSLLAAKCLEFLHLPKLYPFHYSTSSSSHTQLDLVLPLSASQSTFGDVLNGKDAPSPRWRPFHPTVSIAFLCSPARLTSSSGARTNPIRHASLPPVYLRSVFVTLLLTHLDHVATKSG